jgi:SpoVK/Ycf46/Vps4 family AAA+-type ATPase
MFDAFAWQDGTVLKPAIIDDAPPPKAFAPTPTKPPTVKTAIDDIPGTDHELYLSALARLEKLEGLDDVKREVRELVALLRVSRVREQHGSTEEPPTLHYIFAGDPGTGKTTVARIVADLLKSLGYLKQGQCIETDRAGLVAAYTGQTALKTHDIIESAIGGVLFIDEAYTLTPEDRLDPYGPEAIATLLKEMEDRRHDFVVIAAGYTSEMKRFLESNPGLQSRFSQKMTFASLSRTELERVFDSLLQTGRFTADDETRRGVGFLAEKLRASTGESFGNARTIRTIFEKMRRRQSVRITTNGMPTEKEDFYKLILADIPSQEMIGLSPEQLRAQLDKKGFFIASPGAGSILGNPAGPGSTHLN